MIYRILLISVFLGLCNCNRISKVIEKKREQNCLNRWIIEKTHSGLSISKEKDVLITRDYFEGCFDTILFDSLSESIFIIYGKDVFLIDCVLDTIYESHLKNSFFGRLNPGVYIFDGKYIYTNKAEFYLFDRKLSLIYSSWEYISNLPDTNLLGLSGVNIFYTVSINSIIITYKLQTDVYPFILRVINDTIK
jgi:hypothetical protein